MANLGLPVQNVAAVSVVMSPVAAATRNFGSLLILGDSGIIDPTERLRLYQSLAAVASDFGTTAPEYQAAALYFGQSPQPSTLYIGAWARTAQPAILHGDILSPAQQAISSFTSITAGALGITINGSVQNVTGVNLSAVSTLPGVAAALTAKLIGATCVWNANLGRFDIITSTTGPTAAITFATSAGTGTDLATAMQLRSGDGGSTVQGSAAETALAAVTALDQLSNNWYGLTFAASVMPANSDYTAIAGYIEAAGTSRIFGVTTQDTGALNPQGTSDIAYLLQQLSYKRTFVQYSSSSPYACCSIFGRAFTVNFNGSNTTITLKFKQEPGVAPEYLTSTQAAALAAKNCNVFVAYNNSTYIVQEGTMVNGYFFDEVHGTDWLQNAVQTAIYNVLYTSTTKIPQTDAGVAVIIATISNILEQSVANGLVAPGVWTAAGFGALNTGDTLSKGYYVYAPPVASQSAADRQARKSPAIQAAIKLAGAIHFTNLQINVNR